MSISECERLAAEVARAESLSEAERLRRYGTDGLDLLRAALRRSRLRADAETPTPKFAPGQRVFTHEAQESTIIAVNGIAPPYKHSVTGDQMAAEVWYDVRRDDGSRGIFSELHLRAV